MIKSLYKATNKTFLKLTSPTVMTILYSRLTVLTEDVNVKIRTYTITSALSHLRAFVEGPIVRAVSQEDIQRFVVTTEQGRQRRTDRQQRLASVAPPPAPAPAEAPADSSSPMVTEVNGEEEMEVSSGEECQSPTRDIPPADQEAAFPPSLLSVPVLAGSENSSPELRSLPPAWLPIISSDQAVPVVRSQPYSDAYLSGQPSKRRKPRDDVGQLLHQSLQEVRGSQT